MSISCPSCGNPIDVSQASPGATLQCPNCSKSFRTRSAATGQDADKGADTKACRYCGETIKRAAIKCKHCGSDLSAAPSGPSDQANPFYDQRDDEAVIFEGPVSQWTNLGMFIFCGCIAVAGVVLLAIPNVPFLATLGVCVFAVLIALRAWFNVRFLVYRVTTDRVEVERGFIAKRLDNLDMFRVQDVRLNIGILDRLVGIGNVNVISTDKTTPTMTIRGLPDARTVYERLKREALRADRRRGVLHVES